VYMKFMINTSAFDSVNSVFDISINFSILTINGTVSERYSFV